MKQIPPGIFVQANEKGWMNEEYFAIWLKEIWGKDEVHFLSLNPFLLMIQLHLIYF